MKKNLLRKIVSVVLSLGLLAGCSSNENTEAPSNSANNDNNEKVQSVEEDVVTLKWVQVGSGMPSNYSSWLDQINPYLEEKIGVNVDMSIVPWADWDNRRSMIVNAGEEFDILFTDQSRYNAEVAIGALMDITDILPEAAPKLYDMIPEDYWEAAAINGKIYSVPTYKDSSATNYFIWDKKLADDYGIDYENIKTFESLYPALVTINEGESRPPFFMVRSGADYLATTYYDQMGMGLTPIGVHYKDETRTVVNPLTDEKLLAEMDYIHKMYKERLINGDAPNAEETDNYKTFFVAQGWSSAAQTSWGPRFGIDDCIAIQFKDTVMSNTTVRGSLNGIYSGSKNPEKALQLLELVNTDSKVRDLFYYGVEGENFEYNEDKKIHKLNNEWPMAGYTQGTFFNVTQLDTDEINQWDEVKELNNTAVPSVMLGVDIDISSIETEVANCRAVYEKYSSEFWTGAREPRELAATIQAELDAAGWETIRVEAQAQIDALYN